MAGYHCLMPTAFLSLHPIPNLLAFFRCNHITNLSICPRCNPYPIYQHFPLQNIPSINISLCKIYHPSIFPIAIHSQFVCIPLCYKSPNNPISSHFIALTHNGGTKTKNVRGRESTGHSLLFIYVTARLFWQGDGN